MTGRSVCKTALLALLCLTAGACKQSATGDKVVLVGAGSTLAEPLYLKWADVYGKKNPGVQIRYEAVGSGQGISRFMGRYAHPVDFAGSDAALSVEDMAKAESDGRGVVLIPSAGAVIVLAYNLDGLAGELKLPRDVYADIFLGKITKWSDGRIKAANPELKLPDREIIVIVRQDKSGTTFAFTNHLAAISPEWKKRFGNNESSEDAYQGAMQVSWPAPHLLQEPGNQGVAGQVQRTANSLGYVEYGAAKHGGLAMAVLQNKEGKFVKPSGASGLTALLEAKLQEKNHFRDFRPDPPGKNSYPIVTFTWLLLYKNYDNSQKETELRKFVHWCLTEGQEYSESLGFVRLPPEMDVAVLEAVEGGKK